MSVKIVTVGAGGFASNYTRLFLDNLNCGKYEYKGVVEICNDFPYKDEFIANNIPIYKTIEEFFKENYADLTFISTPPHFHAEQSICALMHSSNVLCEKPIASSFSDAKAILDASIETGKFVGIGYQHSFSKPNLDFKNDILKGVFGKPICLKALLSWPRNHQYYGRGNGWAGKIKDANGKIILDSVISNGAAHYLHNMLFLLGKDIQSACLPETYCAELLRANNIENFDTAVIRMETKNNAKLMICATHAANNTINPIFDFQFENASVQYYMGENIIAKFSDGTIKDYGKPMHGDESKMWCAIDAAENKAVLPCIAKTALPHNIIVNSLYENCHVQSFPENMISLDTENEITYVEGLAEALTKCFNENKMLSETGWNWVEKTNFQINEKYKSYYLSTKEQ